VFYSAKTGEAIDRYLRFRGKHRGPGLRNVLLGSKGPLTSDGIAEVVRRRIRDRPASCATTAGRLHPHLLRHYLADRRMSSALPLDSMLELGSGGKHDHAVCVET
jgi:integrase